MRIAYFVHDLTDPAVERRVRMFKEGGADVLITGFSRGPASKKICDTTPHDLGRTADARFLARALTTARHTALGWRLSHRIEGADAIVARNLEMLAIAWSARGNRTDIPLTYECLDIHRLMLSRKLVGHGLRALEGGLSRKVSALMTSSPAFVDHYFKSISKVDLPTILVENKVFLGGTFAERTPREVAPSSARWRIGWFGAIRCLKSFRILSALTRRLDGRLTVTIRGRPAYSEFPDFDAMVAAEPFIQFGGAYRNPEDLLTIYHDVDFAWVIDFFEEGQNSEWLLPNRLYESGWAGTVPIAIGRTATGRWLAERGVGVRIGEDVVEELTQFFFVLDTDQFRELSTALRQIDSRTWLCTPEECRSLVERLTGPSGVSASNLR